MPSAESTFFCCEILCVNIFLFFFFFNLRPKKRMRYRVVLDLKRNKASRCKSPAYSF